MRKVIEVTLVAAILLDLAYWGIWFTQRDWIASEHTEAYYAFENAFPLADLWLGVVCLLALISMRQRQPIALLWLICAGSAGAYLFGMDLLYDIQHGIFAKGAGGAFEAVIVALTAYFSMIVLTYAWGHRGELLAGDSALILHRT